MSILSSAVLSLSGRGYANFVLTAFSGSCLEPDLTTHRSIPKQKAATSVPATKETAQLKASLRDASRSINATTAPLNKAQKAAMMSSPRYVSDSEETNATVGVGTLDTRTTSFGWWFTITLLSLDGKESGSSPRH
jgi:hypothetical protein